MARLLYWSELEAVSLEVPLLSPAPLIFASQLAQLVSLSHHMNNTKSMSKTSNAPVSPSQVNLKRVTLGAGIAMLSLGFFSCTKPADQAQDPRKLAIKRIDSLETVLRAANSVSAAQTQTALRLAEAYQFFALDYKEDSLCLPFIMKEANIYASLGDLPKAAELFDFGYKTYASHPLRPNALFFLGNVLNDMKDSAQSVAAFKQFIATYPDHVFKPDAERMVDFITRGSNALEDFANKRAQQIADSLASVKKKQP